MHHVKHRFDLIKITVYSVEMSEYIDVFEAKTQLTHWIEEVQAGREVVICMGNVPVAKLISIAAPQRLRKIGLAKGTFSVTPEFFDPLPDDLIAAFEGL